MSAPCHSKSLRKVRIQRNEMVSPPDRVLRNQVVVNNRIQMWRLVYEETTYFAFIRLFLGLCSNSTKPSLSISGGTYIPNRPLNPFFMPYQPPIGFFAERPHASTVPSLGVLFSSALPSSIQSPYFFSMACSS